MHRAYLFGTLGLAAIVVLVIVCFNFIVDPYRLYPDINGLRPDARVDLFYRLRLHKPYAMERARAEHLIVGSSRSASLPPRLLGAHAYNASLPGVTLLEMRRMVEHAQALQPLKSLYIGVDYYMFRSGHSLATAHWEDSRLLKLQPTLVERLAHWYQRLEDNWRSLLSVDALISSGDALAGRDGSRRNYHGDGTWDSETPTKPAKWLFSMLNRQKMEEFSSPGGDLEMREFQRLLDFCAEQGIATTVLISPFHGSVMNTVRLAGKWADYLQWQQRVVEITRRYGDSFRVAGLEGSADIVLEPMTAPTPFFVDGVHYTSAAGAAIMACLAVGECGDHLALRYLEAATIASYLDTVDGLMREYPQANPADYALLLKWLHAGERSGDATPPSPGAAPPDRAAAPSIR